MEMRLSSVEKRCSLRTPSRSSTRRNTSPGGRNSPATSAAALAEPPRLNLRSRMSASISNCLSCSRASNTCWPVLSRNSYIRMYPIPPCLSRLKTEGNSTLPRNTSRSRDSGSPNRSRLRRTLVPSSPFILSPTSRGVDSPTGTPSTASRASPGSMPAFCAGESSKGNSSIRPSRDTTRAPIPKYEPSVLCSNCSWASGN